MRNVKDNNKITRNCVTMKKGTVNEKREVVKDLFVLWFALAALGCAAVNLHISLNMLGRKKALEKNGKRFFDSLEQKHA